MKKNFIRYHILTLSMTFLFSLACNFTSMLTDSFEMEGLTIQTENSIEDILQEEYNENFESEESNVLVDDGESHPEFIAYPVISPENADQIIEIDRFGKGYITDMAWSPTGKLLAIGTSIGIYIYGGHNLSDEKYFETSYGISSVAFSQDGLLLASGNQDKTVRLWDVATGEEIIRVGEYSTNIDSLTFSPDGRVLAFPIGVSVILWDMENQLVMGEFVGDTNISDAAFSPDGNLLATIGHFDKTIILWDRVTEEKLMTLQGHNSAVSGIFFTPDGQVLISNSYDSTLCFWDTSTGALLRIVDLELDNAVFSYSSGGALLAGAGNWDKNIIIMDMDTGLVLKTLEGHTHRITNMLVSPNEEYLVSASDDGTVRLWDINSGRSLVVYEGFNSSITSLSVLPMGQILISYSNSAGLWSFGEKEYDWFIDFDEYFYVWDAVLSPDGQTFALFFDWSGLISVRDSLDGKVYHELEIDSPFIITSLAFSPDGSVLASSGYHIGDGGPDGSPPKIAKVQLWDLSSWESIMTFDAQTSSVASMAFSADGNMLVLGAENGNLEIWDITTGTASENFKTDTGGIFNVAFSPDGLLLGIGDHHNNIQLLDTTDWSILRTLQLNSGYAFELGFTFSPNGQLLASVSCDNTVFLWNVASGELLTTLEGHNLPVSSVAFSAEGDFLVTGCTDGTVRIWGVP